MSAGSPVDRRTFLWLGAVSSVGISGCVRRARDVDARASGERVSLTIKTAPADDDPYAIRIAQDLRDHLIAAGIDATVVPIRNDQLLRSVLIDEAFDLYVAAHPGGRDPDFLYPLLHSQFSTEPGWQNPFGYADLATDELLERQRQVTGDARQRAASELQRVVTKKQPFSVLAFPDGVWSVREDPYEGWRATEMDTPLQYLSIRNDGIQSSDRSAQRTATERADDGLGALRVALNDGRATQNLNPIAVGFRNRGQVTDLLYDRLARPHRGKLVPWLAASWEWNQGEADTGPVATVRLRDDLQWHDGRPITADDVAFTYRFLADTSLGRGQDSIPAPRFRGDVSLVDAAESLDSRTVRLTFAGALPDVAGRALTLPVLPEHEWRQRTGPTEIAGLNLFEGITEALVWPNMDPVGSGPFRFQRAVKDETLILERFRDHFAWGGAPDLPDVIADEPAFDRLVFRIAPSSAVSLELIAAGEVHATGGLLDVRAVPGAIRSTDARLLVRPSHSFYHVGYNTRNGALSNPRFRRAVAQLIDKRHAAEEVFGGYAAPAASPLDRSGWLASNLDWTGRDPVLPFVGEDGRLDVERARRVFEEAGYRYNDDGHLMTG